MAKKNLVRIPDHRPITIGGFTLTATGMEVRGRPSFDAYQGVGDFITRAHQSSGWWMVDWLAYGDSRDDWKERLSQASDATGLSEGRLKNLRTLRKIEPSRRRDGHGIELAHHSVVVSLAPEEQTYWLEQAEANGWSERDLRLSIRSAKRRAVIEGQAVLEGRYRVLYADPPWLYNDRQPSGSSTAAHFPGMTIAEIAALPVSAHAMPNAVLALWVTAPMALSNPGPREVGEAWGFTYKQQIIWDKVHGSGGNYTQGNHEILTLWTRGACVPDVQTDLPDSVQVIRKSDEYAQKPAEFRALLEKHWTSGPYLELFGRGQVEGWSVFGNDARLWAGESKAVAV